jgi:hypothetical protein
LPLLNTIFNQKYLSLFSTCKENPVHLFDAYTGKIRCSYMGYNHLDELETVGLFF